jgi:hypothetical protein
MILHWILLVDLAVLSTKLSAFLLVCAHVGAELSRFGVALFFLLLLFSSSISVLPVDERNLEYMSFSSSFVTLVAITLSIYEKDYQEMIHDPALLTSVILFKSMSAILLLNLLIAQLNCSYELVNLDMLGFARLNRAEVIVQVMDLCPMGAWNKFVSSLNFDVPLEFNEGDVGMAGGISSEEHSSLHPVMTDSIHRFGGSCSPAMPWPEEAEDRHKGPEEEERIDHIQRYVEKTLRKATKGAGDGHSGGNTSSGIGTDSDASSSKISVISEDGE